jgi:hypothetical protein
MAFELNTVVPWGRTLEEYESMFMLDINDLNKKIIGFGDGPASFNVQMSELGKKVVSLDPIYQFTTDQIRKRIDETSLQVIKQVEENKDIFIWDSIKDIDHLKKIRIGAMQRFLDDFQKGVKESRYITHSLPDKTTFANDEYDLGLSSHFLMLYSGLGLDFHKAALAEMMRMCLEVRIFPIITLNAEVPDFFFALLEFLNLNYEMGVKKVPYEFQKGGNEMLIVRKKTGFLE